MSEPDEDVTVEEHGVSVRKSLNDHQFETLAVVFDVRSGRDGASEVTLTDLVPEDVPVDDIGFHPEYGGEHWQAGEGQVVFSRTFEPGEQYTTVYGVRDFDGDRSDLLAEPGVEAGEPEVGAGPRGIEDLVSEEDSQVVREVISGERDTLPGLEESGAASAGTSGDDGAEGVEAATGAGGGDGPAGAEAAIGTDDEDDALADVDLPEPGETDLAADLAGEGSADATEDESAESVEADDDRPVEDGVGGLGGDEPDEEAETAEAGEVSADDVDEAETEAADELGGADEAGETPEEEPSMDEHDTETDEDEAETDEVETGVAAVMTDAGGDAPDVDEAEEAEDERTGEPATAGPAAGSDDDEAADADGDAVEEAEAEPDDEITVPVTGGIARVLAKELRAGNVSYEDRRLLREELVPDEGSTDARIQRLQNQVADLAAYTDALEQFLDEEGGAEAALSRIESRVDDLADDVEAVEESLAGIDETVDSLGYDVEDVEDEVEDVGAQVSSVSGDVDEVADDVERLEDGLADVRDDVGRIDAVDRRLGSVEDDVSAIHDELEELATFRDRLSSVFGPGGGMGGGDQGDDEA